MVVGESRITKLVLGMLGSDVRTDIDDYIREVGTRDFLVMGSMEQVNSIFHESLDNFLLVYLRKSYLI